VPTDIPADLQAALAERYELRRVLGRGGMATVYLASDRKHHREVALKVLLPGLAAFLGVERFLKEIEIAARLTHPHVMALHDSGEAGGFLYYVMPYIEGGSLRQELGAGPLGTGRMLAVAAPVADALSYAHRMGVLHRDIKPENILFSQGHPIVGDFGIAKAIVTAGGANLTRTGFPVGTPGYMSPEQAAGLTDLDPSTDVYSLAVVLYEMLVGELPGRWPTEDAVRAGRFLEAAPAHRTRLVATGPAIEGALVRGLAIRHDQRTATPAALVAELQGEPAAPRRRFSGDEVQDIVKRASELEATTPTASGAMTIGGVEALAAEVGIAPETVRAAVRGVASPGVPAVPARHNRVLGGPTKILFERVVEGELPETEYSALVEEIRRVVGQVGLVSQLGRSFSWSTSRGVSSRRDMEVAVSVRGGRTRIAVQESLGQVAGAVFAGIGGGMGGGGMGPIIGIFAGALHMGGSVIGVLVPLWLATTFLTARAVYSRTSRKRERELEQLADRLAAIVRDAVAEQPPALRRPAP